MSPEADDAACAHPVGSARADSAGVPWEGRQFEPNQFSGDDGSADPALAAARAAFTSGQGSAAGVVAAYRSARLLIPLVARAGDEGIGAHGLAVDKTQELSIVTVAGPDGRRVLPVFSSVAAMSAWDRQARPVPAGGARTAVAALEDGTDLIVIDPGSASPFVLRRPALWALARGEAWEPAHLNAKVYAGFHESIGSELAVLDLLLSSGDPLAHGTRPELLVELQLTPGLNRDELDAVLQRLARRWAADDRIAELVDSLSVKLHRADAPADGA